jgi:precorrin-4/cobalt-precorrin-4 C11-methyltransferase
MNNFTKTKIFFIDPTGRAPGRNRQSATTHPVLFVGAGPGDPELLTIKGKKALEAADVVIYTGSLVPEALLKWTRPETESINSASMNLEEIIAAMEKAFTAGKRVVRLHTGDPSLYGAIMEQIVGLQKKSISYKVIPGVTAAFAAAAALGIEYTLPELSQTLILTRMAGRTPVPDSENLTALAQHRSSMAIYLSISLIDEVAAILSASYGPDAGCAVVYCVSRPDERVIVTRLKHLAKTVKSAKITRNALVIISKALNDEYGTLMQASKLYSKNFKHGYRK